MKCEYGDRSWWLLGFMDGTIDPETMRRLEEHLKTCEDCRTALAEYRETWNLLDAYLACSPKTGFVSDTMKALAMHRRVLRRSKIRLAAVAAAAVLLLGAVFLFGFLNRSNPGGLGHGETKVVEADLLENLDLIEDMDFLVEYGEDLELAMEVDLYDLLSEEENL